MTESWQHGSHTLENHQQTVDEILHDRSSVRNSASRSSLFAKLPAELLHQILSHLSAQDLACVSVTCRTLAEHGSNDLLWAEIVNSYLPFRIHDPGPFPSFLHLYLAHHPCWFIPQHKIWFADNEHTGNLILARYDNRRGVIEAYRIIAERREPQFHIWESNPEVIIQAFNPKVGLWLDDPILLLKDPEPSRPRAPWQSFTAERRMPMASGHVSSSFSLCSTKPPRNSPTSPYNLWPPPTIPSETRAHRDFESGTIIAPRRSSDVSERAFRVKRWANFGMQMNIILSPGHSERLLTYATLDPTLYAQTKEKPYQGIWVGDYSAHGCEFLLFLQRDSVAASSASRESSFAADEDTEDGLAEMETKNNGIVQQGGLEAIKLTGDPNVPRGEISFVAEDIGPRGLVRVADEDPFKGARIVRCLGHVAGQGFRDGRFPLLLTPFDLVPPTLTIRKTRYLYHVTAHPHIHGLYGPLLGGDGTHFLLSARGYRHPAAVIAGVLFVI